MGTTGKVVGPEDGELIAHDGWEALIRLGADATGGAFTIIETRHDAGGAAGPHIHSRESETFLVLEGTVTFRLGNERVELGAGGIAFGPAGTIHDFAVGPDGGRLLHLFVPSGMEGFFRAPRIPGAGVRLRRHYGVESISE